MDKELLPHYRDQIDTIDGEIVYLLSRRFEIVKQIWTLKKKHNIPARQQNRFKDLLQRLIEDAKHRGVNEELIKDIYNRIHEESLRLEK